RRTSNAGARPQAFVTRWRGYHSPSWDQSLFARWNWETVSAGARWDVETPGPSAAKPRPALSSGNSASVLACSGRTSTSIRGDALCLDNFSEAKHSLLTLHSPGSTPQGEAVNALRSDPWRVFRSPR